MGWLIDMVRGMQKAGNDFVSNSDDSHPDDDYLTKDRALRSLRRQRRIQLEEVEKEELKNRIADHIKGRERRFLWGVADDSPNIIRTGSLGSHDSNILSDDRPILGQKRKFI